MHMHMCMCMCMMHMCMHMHMYMCKCMSMRYFLDVTPPLQSADTSPRPAKLQASSRCGLWNPELRGDRGTLR